MPVPGVDRRGVERPTRNIDNTAIKNASMQELNRRIANQLRRIAALLDAQKANPFRINAYRHAADTLEHLEASVADILDAKGIRGLIALPAIGEGIAHSVYEYVATGRMSRLESLQGGNYPETWLRRIPTVGRGLASRIHAELHVDSLDDLERVRRNGELARLDGVGGKRLEAIETWMRSQRERQKHRSRPGFEHPGVDLILRIDREYRAEAAAGRLPKIAPRRFNPDNRAWLPILHTTRRGWHFTALFSNTARAHQLGHTDDWVVIYFYDDRHREAQHTVVTETHGRLEGERVVRGRELECEDYYTAASGR